MMTRNNVYVFHATGAVDMHRYNAPMAAEVGGLMPGGAGRRSSGHRCAGPSEAVAVTEHASRNVRVYIARVLLTRRC